MSNLSQDETNDTVPLSALVSQINSDQASAQRTADRYARSGALDTCSFNEGYQTQLVFACLTCKTFESNGFCLGCSMHCHVEHDVIETGRKRHFRCDCGTSRLPQSCQLLKKPHGIINDENVYNQNFLGLFCHCSLPYDPETESKDMIMCCRCQDWFHDDPSCIGEASGKKSSCGLYLCANCVQQAPILLSYHAAPSVDSSVPDSPKKASCRKPVVSVEPITHGIYLREDIRTVICTCDKCFEHITEQNVEFLIGEDISYDEDEEENDDEGLDAPSDQLLNPEFDPEMILQRALSRMPRELAIEGALKFRQFTDNVILGLKKITSADQTRVITVEDVNSICSSILGKRNREDDTTR